MGPTVDVRGVPVPSFFYGTAWKDERTTALTALALSSGFAAIDTANQRKHYFEAGVGEALKSAFSEGLAREDVFLQTKFTYARGQDHRLPYDPRADFGTQVGQSLASSLEHLGVGYVDSYLLHGPERSQGITANDRAVWRAMEQAARHGTARLLGVSNVALLQLDALCREADVKPAFVQNRCYARTGWDRGVRTYCRQNDILYQGFSLLTANGRELAQPAITRIAEQAQATVAQVIFRFAQLQSMIPLTGTSSAAHMREDLASSDVQLSAEDVETIDRIGG